MATTSPYRSLPAERRIALLLHAITVSREARALYTQRLISRGGGFRAVTLNSWTADKLAREIVRMKAEQPQDELDLLHLLYVELEPAIQIDFLDTARVAHERGVMAESLQPPFADEAAVRLAAAKVMEQHGADGARYLQTLARYSAPGWPGIVEIAGTLNA
jgi:Cdc6-like AAA superfamily ATPase